MLDKGGVFLGNNSLTMSEVEAMLGTDSIKISGLQVGSESASNDNRFNTSLGMMVKNIVYAGQNMGSGKVDIALTDLDYKTLSRLNGEILKKRREGVNEVQSSMFIMSNLQKQLTPLLQYSPKLEIVEMALNTQSGAANLRGQLAVNAKDKSIENPLILLNALQGEVKVELPRTVLSNIFGALIRARLAGHIKLSDEEIAHQARTAYGSYMNPLVKKNIFVLQDEVFRLQAKIANGVFLLNGQEIPLNPAIM